MDDLTDFLTLAEMSRRYAPTITENALRWQIRNRSTNGLAAARAITKQSGRWLVHRGRSVAWLAGDAARPAA